VREAIEALPVDFREAIVLRELDGRRRGNPGETTSA